MFLGNRGGVRGPFGQRALSEPASDFLHEDGGAELFPDGAVARGNEDLGRRHIHGRRGIPRVPEQPTVVELGPRVVSLN